ncbi:MAG: SDR family oxidoreductase [Solirubrobacteraceae bacterium]
MTGAATGIGKATAIRLASAGANVVINHLDTPAAADALATQIAEDGGDTIVIAADVAQHAEVERLFAAAADHYGSVDVVVNNAAVATLARELGSRSITVNAVSSGATETDSYRDGKDPEFIAGLERMSAFNRLGRVAEIADVIAFLAGDQARWITGQNLRVNGGTV